MDRSRAAMALGAAVWGQGASSNSRKRKKFTQEGALKWGEKAVKDAQAAAAASRSQEGNMEGSSEGAPVMVAGKKATASSVRKWRKGLADGELNAGQRKVVEKVAGRVLAQEFASSAQGKKPKCMEPLLWVMHGGPGTGKSFVVDKIRKELFEQEMGWTHGIDFQVAALQATNASALDGNTIHSAFGMGVNKATGRNNKDVAAGETKKKTTNGRGCSAHVAMEVADHRRDQHGEREFRS